MISSTEQVTDLLLDWSNGSEAALDRLTPLVYEELHRLAHRHMRRERRYQRGHTLQTSALRERGLPAPSRSGECALAEPGAVLFDRL